MLSNYIATQKKIIKRFYERTDVYSRLAKKKNLNPGGETVLFESWLCSILPNSLHVINKTALNILTLLFFRNLFDAKRLI